MTPRRFLDAVLGWLAGLALLLAISGFDFSFQGVRRGVDPSPSRIEIGVTRPQDLRAKE